MSGSVPRHPVVCLNIDITKAVCNCFDPVRRKNFLGGVRDFNSELRDRGIPIITVSYGDINKIYHGEKTSPASEARMKDPMLLIKYGLLELAPRRGDDVVIKANDDVFQVPGLAKMLHQYQTKTVIIIGTNTTVCIPACAYGACDNGFEPWVISDRVADVRVLSGPCGIKKDATPRWHETALRRMLADYAQSKIMRAGKCLDALDAAKDAAHEPYPSTPVGRNLSSFKGVLSSVGPSR